MGINNIGILFYATLRCKKCNSIDPCLCSTYWIRMYSLSPGYNSRTPNSAVGKIAAMILAILGLPILFIYLTVVGSTLARAFTKFYSVICCCCVRKRRGICRPPASNNSTLEKSGASNASDQPFSRDQSFSKPTWPTSSGHPSLCQDCATARRRRELRLNEDLSSQV